MQKLNQEENVLKLKNALKEARTHYNELPNYGYSGNRHIKSFIETIGLGIDDLYDDDNFLDFIDYSNVYGVFERIENEYVNVIKDSGWKEKDREFEESDAYKTLSILYSNKIKFNSLVDELKLEACIKLYNKLSLNEIEELLGEA
jgi:hypothetical protein